MRRHGRNEGAWTATSISFLKRDSEFALKFLNRLPWLAKFELEEKLTFEKTEGWCKFFDEKHQLEQFCKR